MEKTSNMKNIALLRFNRYTFRGRWIGRIVNSDKWGNRAQKLTTKIPNILKNYHGVRDRQKKNGSKIKQQKRPKRKKQSTWKEKMKET